MKWILFILVSLFISFLVKLFLFPSRHGPYKLPPGPSTFPILTNFLWLRQSPLELESLLRSFIAKYGPILTVHLGPAPAIIISDRSIAHKALVQNGAIFADRPHALSVNRITASANLDNIASASYGPTWRLLRRNLAAEMLHPSRVRAYSRARKWVLDILIARLSARSGSEGGSVVVEHFHFAMFCLLVLMCFGDKLNETQILEIQQVQREILVNLQRFVILNLWPKLMKILLRKRWKEYLQLKSKQQKVLIPFIKAREKVKEERSKTKEEKEEFVVSYVDTLLDLQLIDEKRKLKNEEMVNLCSEFLNAGTDTTATTLQWIMANLVKYPQIQQKLFEEIKGVKGSSTKQHELREEEVKEEDLGKLPYLKAVILEGLRRHPPGHFMLPHAVKEDTTLENYFIPKNGIVNIYAVEMGWDPQVWEDPMAFKPERFMSNVGGETTSTTFDITGSKEIKMMPFGAGRRICPGAGLAMLHLEYFVANLVWRFEWKAMEGEVDLSEKMEFTIVMKNPLKAYIHPRF
ncbi:cytochrome P450 89A2-like isoform X2 [Benincasa hispida]|uniref:cytochrome P450 89A2-like isoform X2 n=1 Tax=Benincasa hispida TaxID=102211 RepID=UPI00190173D7|nr:cytochrome P450 89A2-like isoform X2 [Benincasa hispida]